MYNKFEIRKLNSPPENNKGQFSVLRRSAHECCEEIQVRKLTEKERAFRRACHNKMEGNLCR